METIPENSGFDTWLIVIHKAVGAAAIGLLKPEWTRVRASGLGPRVLLPLHPDFPLGPHNALGFGWDSRCHSVPIRTVPLPRREKGSGGVRAAQGGLGLRVRAVTLVPAAV